MFLRQIDISGYTSLKDISLKFDDLTVLVGPNNSGKSNVLNAIEFVSEAYRTNLTEALRESNISFFLTKTRKSHAHSMRFRVLVNLTSGRKRTPSIVLQHAFTIVPTKARSSSTFRIDNEVLNFLDFGLRPVLSIHRIGSRLRVVSQRLDLSDLRKSPNAKQLLAVRDIVQTFRKSAVQFEPTELAVRTLASVSPLIRSFVDRISAIAVFEPDPDYARNDSEKTSRPQMDRWASNLPAVLAYMREFETETWTNIVEQMRTVFPDLEELVVEESATGNLAIFFKESGYEKPWLASEVSDGTMRALALFTALFDPRISVLMIEEPENSAHPWIIRRIVEACHRAGKAKQIILATHSPIVMNSVKPSSVVVVARRNGVSKTRPLLEYKKPLGRILEKREIDTFDVFDSGSILDTIPAPPSLSAKS